MTEKKDEEKAKEIVMGWLQQYAEEVVDSRKQITDLKAENEKLKAGILETGIGGIELAGTFHRECNKEWRSRIEKVIDDGWLQIEELRKNRAIDGHYLNGMKFVLRELKKELLGDDK